LTRQADDNRWQCYDDTDHCIFRPSLPGNFTFQYHAEDLCDGKISKSFDIQVKCPQAPNASLVPVDKLQGTEVLQGTEMSFDASASSASSRWPTNSWKLTNAAAAQAVPAQAAPDKTELIYHYALMMPNKVNYTEWRRVKAPYRFTLSAADTSAAGDYKVKLRVYDGCSFGQFVYCFTIKCNCGPTANAKARIAGDIGYRNMHYQNKYILDASDSYDFDVLDMPNLQMQWTFHSWEPAPKMPFSTMREPLGAFQTKPFPDRQYHPDPLEVSSGNKIWSAGLTQAATALNFGYEVRKRSLDLNGPRQELHVEYAFVRLPKLIQAVSINETTDVTGRGAPTIKVSNETCTTYTNNKAYNDACAVEAAEAAAAKKTSTVCKDLDKGITDACQDLLPTTEAKYPRWVAARQYTHKGGPDDETHSLYFNDISATERAKRPATANGAKANNGYQENFQKRTQTAIVDRSKAANANDRLYKDWTVGDVYDPKTLTENVYDPVTTSCVAYVTKTVKIVTESYPVTETSKTPLTAAGAEYKFCAIQISQVQTTSKTAELTFMFPMQPRDAEQSKNGQGTDINSYKAYGTVPPLPTNTAGQSGMAYEACRGIWKFNLTVLDLCGTATADVDQVTLSLRCNKPPVAVLCCNTTVVYNAAAEFPQVTLDGRSSNDGGHGDSEGDDLTYYWSMAYNRDHEAKCYKTPQKCEQTYCDFPGVTYTFMFTGQCTGLTNPTTREFHSKSHRWYNSRNKYTNCNTYPPPDGHHGVAAYTRYGPNQKDTKCGLDIYRPIYDQSDKTPVNCLAPGSGGNTNTQAFCEYNAVSNTQYHVGNTAYFKPTVPGTYLVQLAVHDGCSTTVDSTTITAVCPVLSGTVSVSPRSGFYYPPGSDAGKTSTKIELKSTIQYEGDLATSALTYTWTIQPPGGSANEYSCENGCATAQTSFTPRGRGTFTVTLKVKDGCQEVTIGTPVTVLIECNSPPVANPVVTAGRGGFKWSATPGPVTLTPVDAQTRTLNLYASNLTFPQVRIWGDGTDAENEALTTVWSITDVRDVKNQVDASTQFVDAASNRSLQFTPNFERCTAANFDKCTPLVNATIADRQYDIAYRVRDGCQESLPISVRVRYSCTATLRVVLSPLDLGFDYSYASNSFPSGTVDAATAQSTLPYKDNTLYLWRLRLASGGSNSDITSDVSGTINLQTDKLTWTPVNTQLNVYRVELQVRDGCTEVTVSSRAESKCPVVPVANLKGPDATTVEWNSRGVSLYAGKFPTITVDGSGSTLVGAPIQKYTYTVLTTGESRAKLVSNATDAPATQFTYQPKSPQVYEFRLQVSNGPCVSLTSPTLRINVVCLRLSFSMKTAVGSVTAPQQASFVANWNGVRFANVDLDASAVSYTDSTGTEANYNSLRYTWTVLTSPQTPVKSLFETNQAASRTTADWTIVGKKVVPEVSADWRNITTTFTKVKRTFTVDYKTTLFNHHFNRPVTCFRPDVAGEYTIQLKIEDGCLSPAPSMAISIRAICTNPLLSTDIPVTLTGSGVSGPSVVGGGGRQAGIPTYAVTLSGWSYSRVTFDARTVTPKNGRDTLTYEWAVLSVKSTMEPPVKKEEIRLTNMHGNIASFVPVRAGTYSIQLNVYDGCNSVSQSTLYHLVVSCPANQIDNFQYKIESFDHSNLAEVAGVGTGKKNVLKAGATLKQLRANAEIQYKGLYKNNKGVIPAENEFHRKYPDTGEDKDYPMTQKTYVDTITSKATGFTLANSEIDQAFATNHAESADSGLGTYYKLSALNTQPCYVRKSYFKYIKRTCSLAYQPPPEGIVSDARCKSTRTCVWSVIEYPCKAPEIGWTKNGANANTPLLGKDVTAQPQACEIAAGAGKIIKTDKNYCSYQPAENTCHSEFKCRAPGTYTLKLRVDDGCSVVEENTTVTCKCQNVLRAALSGPQIVQYKCDSADSQYRFGIQTLNGKFTVNTPRGGTGYLDMVCPTTPKTATPTVPVIQGSCCPQPSPCPACNKCPACSCSSGRTGSAPAPSTPSFPSAGAVPAGPGLLKAKQAFHARREETESLNVMLGTAVPIAAVTVISLIANIILFKIYQSEE
jgi:hypothetical protein